MFYRRLGARRTLRTDPFGKVLAGSGRFKARSVLIAVLAVAFAVGGCGSEQSANVAPDRPTTVPLAPSEVLPIGPSSADSSERRIFKNLLQGLAPLPGVTFTGGFPSPDEGSLDYGFPPEPCTPAQRLDADELGPYESTTDGFRLEDESARGGFRLIWFDSAAEATDYMTAYRDTCDSYETVQQGGAPRGIRRAVFVETDVNLVDGVDEVSILSSEWRATANDRSWGNDILYTVQIDNVVVESALLSGASIEDMRPEAETLFLKLVDHVESKIRP